MSIQNQPSQSVEQVRYDAPEYTVDHLEKMRRHGAIVPPARRQGSTVAIIGAGAAGLSAAYELARVGVMPLVYEASDRIGGRMYSYRFPGDPRAIAELGAMRFPPTSRLLFHYLKNFEIPTRLFPDPLIVPTTIAFQQLNARCKGPEELPPHVQAVSVKWREFVDSVLETTRAAYTVDERRCAWKKVVVRYAQTSFHGALVDDGWSREEVNLFGSLGLGTGGFDSLYTLSFLEILRIVLCRWEVDQQVIIGGADQLPRALWQHERETHGLGQTSVAALNNHHPRPGVRRIERDGDSFAVIDQSGGRDTCDAVILTCSLPVLQLGIDLDPGLLSDEVNLAIRRVHQIGSTKIFARTKTAFWKHDPNITPCTITDLPTRGTYLFDFENTESGVACLSYTWEDDSRKMLALDDEERLDLCRRNLECIFGRDILAGQVEETVTISWEQTPGYHGAFKLNRPGEHEDQHALYNQNRGAESARDNGLYLAGDGVSFSGGWVEGALVTGLNAAAAAVRHIDRLRDR